MKSAIAEIAQTYGIENWGAGYFDINSRGHLVVSPRRKNFPSCSVFPKFFASQVRKMNQSFRAAMKEFDYKGEHLAFFR